MVESKNTKDLLYCDCGEKLKHDDVNDTYSIKYCINKNCNQSFKFHYCIKECEKHEYEYKYQVYSNGTKHCKKQCKVCGDKQSVKKAEALNLNELSEIDIDFFTNKRQEDRLEASKLHQKYNEWRNKLRKNSWLKQHADYLNTNEWKEKRQKVLKRDNFLCQSCLESQATQVHHLTYKHWQNEPLFELISVCQICHESITELDRNNE